MKLVFLDTGDYLDFEPENNIFIEKWFEEIFERGINEYQVFSTSYENIEKTRMMLNDAIEKSNKYASSKIKNFPPFLQELSGLDQDELNDAHKRWVSITESYINELNPQPDFWMQVNDYIHMMERYYFAFFSNSKGWLEMSENNSKYLKPDYCQYDQHDLVIQFNNLGRHQYNQWLTNSKVDEETNNYNIISMNFEYHFNLDVNPKVEETPPHPAYVKWCSEQGIEVVPPWIPIGKFKKYHRNEVRKLFHKNLKNNKRFGFKND